MTPTSSMTPGEAEAYRRGLADGFADHKQQSQDRMLEMVGELSDAENIQGALILANVRARLATIRAMEPPA